MMLKSMAVFGVVASVFGLVACSGQLAPDPHPGATLYKDFCVACHGVSGRGDGRISAELPIAPSDLTQLRAGNGGVFPTERVMTQVHGYPGRFHQGLMPEFGPVLGGDMVEWTSPKGETILTPQPLLDLVAYVETLQES